MANYLVRSCGVCLGWWQAASADEAIARCLFASQCWGTFSARAYDVGVTPTEFEAGMTAAPY